MSPLLLAVLVSIAAAQFCEIYKEYKNVDYGVLQSQDSSRTYYTNNLNCKWQLSSSNTDTRYKIKILEFNTECAWDSLYVYESPSKENQIGRLCGNRLGFENTIVSSGNSMYLEFSSDPYGVSTGFKIEFQSFGTNSLI
jgi:hypothetical protein